MSQQKTVSFQLNDDRLAYGALSQVKAALLDSMKSQVDAKEKAEISSNAEKGWTFKSSQIRTKDSIDENGENEPSLVQVVAQIILVFKKDKLDEDENKTDKNKNGNDKGGKEAQDRAQSADADQEEDEELEQDELEQNNENSEFELGEEQAEAEYPEEELQEFQFQHDVERMIDTGDLEGLAHDIDMTDQLALPVLQTMLMDHITALPSVGTQAGLLAMVADLAPENMVFRHEAAAHLAQFTDQPGLPQEEKLLASASIEVMNDMDNRFFDTVAPASLAACEVVGQIPPVAELPASHTHEISDETLEDIRQEIASAQDVPAPMFTPHTQEESPVFDAADFSHDPTKLLLAEFKANEEITERLDVPQPEPTYETVESYAAPAASKAHNIWMAPAPPTAAIFGTSGGNTSFSDN